MKRFAPLLLLALPGCISTAAHIVTAPVRVAGWTADKLTTSQAESDRNRGRREREADEKAGREARKEAKRQAREARQRDD